MGGTNSDHLTVAFGRRNSDYWREQRHFSTRQVTILRNTLSVLAFAALLGTQCVPAIAATPTFTVTATVAGLTPNSGLVLQDGTDVVSVSSEGTVTFPTALPSGASYNVSVAQVPGNPVQYCSVTSGSGTIGTANVTAPRVVCAVRYGRFAYTVGSCPDSCANALDQTISIFGLAANGQWRHRGYQPTSGTTTAVRVFPSQAWLYATTSPPAQFGSDQTSTSTPAGTLSGYLIDSTTGRLTLINSAATASGPNALEFDPQGRFAFVANASTTFTPSAGEQSLDSISSFSINARSGALTATGTLTLNPSLGDPKKIVADPTGHFLYAIFMNSGTTTAAPVILTAVINQSNGALTLATPVTLPAGITPVDLQFDPAGRSLYVVAQPNSVIVFHVNPSTGALTQFSTVSAGATSLNSLGQINGPASIAIDPASQFAYVLLSSGRPPSSTSFNQVSVFSIDPQSGALTLIKSPTISTTVSLASVQMDPSGNFLEVAGLTPNASTAGLPNARNLYEIATFPISRSTGLLTGNTDGSSLQALLPVSRVETRGFVQTVANVTIARGSSPAMPLPTFALAMNVDASTISTYSINTSTGLLTAQNTTTINGRPVLTAEDQLGLTTYVAMLDSPNVSAFSITPGTGAVGLIGTGSGQTNTSSLVVDPTGHFAYTSLGPQIQSFNGASPGTVVSTSATTGPFADLTIDPTGQYLYAPNGNGNANSISVFVIDPNSGSLTLSASVSTSGAVSSVNTDPAGRFVYSQDNSGNLTEYAVSPVGGLTAVGPAVATLQDNCLPLAIDPSGRFAYVASFDTATIEALSVDPVSGALTLQGSASTGIRPSALSIDPSGKFLYLTGIRATEILSFRIDPTSGALTAIQSPTVPENLSGIITTGTTP